MIALFGFKDDVVNCHEEYMKYYEIAAAFDGGHQLSPENIDNVIFPLIKEKLGI